MKLLAVSGGVDSMVLANLYKEKNVILAYVNYNIREDTHIDQKIVEDFAQKNNLKLEKLILNKNEIIKENFENWARNIRYSFFKKIYKKYNCSELLIAHHKDDFLETCLMQEKKNSNKLFYGIKKVNYLFGMKINRPLLFRYWKSEIYDFAQKNNIKYHDDYTNFDDKYERNKIRNELKTWNSSQKQTKLDYFLSINKVNEQLIEDIKKEYKEWIKSLFDVKKFLNFTQKAEILTIFINKRAKNINLNQKILNNLISFIESKENQNKCFLLSNNWMLIKKNNKLALIKAKASK